MHKFGLGSIFTTPLGNKIIVIGLEDNGKYVISANNGNTVLRGLTESDIMELKDRTD